jgi:hypothetical protein
MTDEIILETAHKEATLREEERLIALEQGSRVRAATDDAQFSWEYVRYLHIFHVANIFSAILVTGVGLYES